MKKTISSKFQVKPEVFIEKAVKGLVASGTGIHTKFSGLENAWKAYYGPDKPLTPVLFDLSNKGKIVLEPKAKGGYMVYLPNNVVKTSCPALNKMGL